MTAAPVLVEASLPQCCDVCAGKRVVRVWLETELLQTFLPCFHCVWNLPIRYYPREAR